MRALARLLFVLAAFCTAPAAAEPLRIVGYENTRLLPAVGEGPYGRLMAELLARVGTSVDLRVLPGKRANLMMYGRPRRADCEFPSALEHLTAKTRSGNRLIESRAMNHARAHVFTRPGSTPVRRMEDLHGKQVGIVRGFGYGAEMNALIELGSRAPIRFVEVDDELQHVRLLTLTSRVDAILGYLPEIAIELEQAGAGDVVYDPAFPLLQTGDRLLCHHSVAAEKLIQAMDKQLQAMGESGALKRILGAYYLSPTSQ